MTVLITDTPPPDVDMSAEPYDVLFPKDVGMAPSWLMTHTCKELSAAAKPGLLLHALAHGAEAVIFTDPDAVVLAPMPDVDEQVSRRSLTISPHFLGPVDADDATGRFIEDRVVEAGAYNGGLIGATGSDEAIAFLRWWMSMMEVGCRHRLSDAQHFDQRWLEMVPSFVVNWARFTDPGLNVSFWRIPGWESPTEDGRMSIDARACRHLHFSGFVPEYPDSMVQYFPDLLSLDQVPGLEPAYRQYGAALEREGRAVWRSAPYGFGHFEDGAPVPDAGRHVYAEMGAGRERFGDPFRSGPRSFQAYLDAPGDNGQPAITREWIEAHRRSEHLATAFPDPLGRDRAAFHAWTQTDNARQSRVTPYILF